MADLPIMCTVTPDALRTRREGLLSELLRHAIGREELPDGLRLRFAPSGETLATIARAVEAERLCCRFLRFAIIIEPGGGPISLELNGSLAASRSGCAYVGAPHPSSHCSASPA